MSSRLKSKGGKLVCNKVFDRTMKITIAKADLQAQRWWSITVVDKLDHPKLDISSKNDKSHEGEVRRHRGITFAESQICQNNHLPLFEACLLTGLCKHDLSVFSISPCIPLGKKRRRNGIESPSLTAWRWFLNWAIATYNLALLQTELHPQHEQTHERLPTHTNMRDAFNRACITQL